MTIEWRITQKPDFFKVLLALPPKETHQVLEKINLLVQDPTPDAKVKKQLKHMNGRLLFALRRRRGKLSRRN